MKIFIQKDEMRDERGRWTSFIKFITELKRADFGSFWACCVSYLRIIQQRDLFSITKISSHYSRQEHPLCFPWGDPPGDKETHKQKSADNFLSQVNSRSHSGKTKNLIPTLEIMEIQ